MLLLFTGRASCRLALLLFIGMGTSHADVKLLGKTSEAVAKLKSQLNTDFGALSVKGVFTEEGTLSGEKESVVTRDFQFSAIIPMGGAPKIYLEFDPAKTLRVGPPQSYAFWKGEFGSNGSEWYVKESSKAPDKDDISKMRRLTVGYNRPVELGDAGRSLLGFDALMPWTLLCPMGGEPTSLTQILEDPGTTAGIDGDTLIIIYTKACVTTTVQLDKTKNYSLQSIEIVNNCGDGDDSLVQRISVEAYKTAGLFSFPSKLLRTIRQDEKLLSTSTMELSEIELVSSALLDEKVSNIAGKVPSGIQILDERTGGQYFLDEKSFTIDTPPTE